MVQSHGYGASCGGSEPSSKAADRYTGLHASVRRRLIAGSIAKPWCLVPGMQVRYLESQVEEMRPDVLKQLRCAPGRHEVSDLVLFC